MEKIVDLPADRIPDIDPEFIVICASAWMKEDGFGIAYSWDGKRLNNRNDAIRHGWKVRGSDDFNLAQTYGDDLIWFGWMDERIDEDEDVMRNIADQIGLTFDPRWYALEYSRATGRVIGSRAALAASEGRDNG